MTSSRSSLVLIVDASIAGVAVAVADLNKQDLVYEGQHPENQGSVLAISRLVAAAMAHDVRGLIVGSGPGSFTGIKVGLAFAYGFRAACGTKGGELPILGLSALGCAAHEFGGTLLLPATKTHGFMASATAGELPETWSVAGALVEADTLELPPSPHLGIVGAWPRALDRLAQRGGDKAAMIPPDAANRLALRGLARAARAAWAAGIPEAKGGLATAIPPPRYLRLSTAEERLATQTLESRP